MNIHRIYAPFLHHFRRKRMHRFARLYPLSRVSRILDVGGSQFNWQFIADRPEIVVTNLSRPADWDDSLAGFTFETGDGTALGHPDKSFDIVYSNSVIEHLGDMGKQGEIRRRSAARGHGLLRTDAGPRMVFPH